MTGTKVCFRCGPLVGAFFRRIVGGQTSAYYWDHRSGRLLSGRTAALEGLRGHRLIRRSSTLTIERISHIQDQITLVSGDLVDEVSLINVLRDYRPSEVYNLAAQSFVQTSWTQPC